MWKVLLLTGCIIAQFVVHGQHSDLFLLDFNKIGDGYEVTNPKFLSDFNVGGYTNQPSFSSPDQLLVSVGGSENTLETDLYQLDLRSSKVTRLTKTIDREYSPRSTAGNTITCVLVDVEQDNNQVLWQYPQDLSNGGKHLLKEAKNVGYYCFLKDDWVAVFEVGNPNNLYLYHPPSGQRHFVSSKIGRSLHKMKDGSLAYVHKFSDSYWFLKKVAPDNFRPSVIKKTIPDAEDFVVLPDGSIIMGKDSKLFRLDTEGDLLWKEIANLAKYGISDITRLAFNGINKLAVVVKR